MVNFTVEQALEDLIRFGALDEVAGCIKAGKESDVFLGVKRGMYVAIKVYLVYSSFKRRSEYGFKGSRSDRIWQIYEWAEREYRYLRRAFNAGVLVPAPILIWGNILLMRFIGEDGVPAPKLLEVEISNPDEVLNEIVENLRRLYWKAELVHGDLSPYNILLYKDKPFLIDFPQAVDRRMPGVETLCDELLRRDINRVCRYFKKLGVDADEDSIYIDILRNPNNEDHVDGTGNY